MTIQEFAQAVQKNTGKNIEFLPCTTTGPAHCPTVTIALIVPKLGTFFGSGSNQRIAKQVAVNRATPDCKYFFHD